MWQSLFDANRDRGFVVLAVAMDQPDAARPWIEAASPSYPCLIDRDHHLAALYHLVNVPQAIWFDEQGHIVRPPETAGATEGFRRMDRQTFAMPDEAVAERQRTRAAYLAALEDWIVNGDRSRYVLDALRATQRLSLPDPAAAEAHAWFRLGLQRLRDGAEEEAVRCFERATQLHPDSWAMWRQTATKDGRGLAAGPAFWARVDALGDRAYYKPVDLGDDDNR